MHAVRKARGFHQSLHIGDLGRDRGSGRADGDQAEVCRTFWRRLNILVRHFKKSVLLRKGGEERRIHTSSGEPLNHVISHFQVSPHSMTLPFQGS